MKKTSILKSAIFSVCALASLFVFAKQEKVVQIFRNGAVIQEYKASEIDYIEVNDVELDTSDGSINGHGYVDLGLPSGLKWATCNVGASTSTEYGDYFAWGETSPKSEYTLDNCQTWGKEMGDISGDPNYDAARANWGGTWRMPSSLECQELIDKCSWSWTTKSGIIGYEVTGPNGKSIFLPAAGSRYGTSHYYAGSSGFYWSSTPDGTNYACELYFGSGSRGVDGNYRFDGRSVRAVSGEFNDVISAPDDVIATVSGNQITIKWNAVAGASYNVYRSADDSNFSLLASKVTTTSYTDANPLTGINYYRVKAIVGALESDYSPSAAATLPEDYTINGHEYVDLGLPSGLKWATCNIGASTPTEYGDYFAWGETSPNSKYTENTSQTYGKEMGDISGDSNYDAACANWGGTWRIPTQVECQELIDKCSWSWTTNNGINGYEVTGPNGKSIFLPAAGYRTYTSHYDAGSYGLYWSSTPYGTNYALVLFFDSGDRRMYDHRYRHYGQSVRAVSE